MQWTAGLSRATEFDAAVAEACTAIEAGLGGEMPTVTTVFVSPGYREHFVRLHRALLDRFPDTHLVGCSGDGLIGDGIEVEEGPALVVAGGFLPNVEAQPFHLQADEVPPPGAPEAAWRDALRLPGGVQPHFLLLPDPFSLRVDDALAGLDAAFEGSTKIGGVLSGAPGPGQGVLYAGREAYGAGMAGVALWGNIELDSIVAQGCRPIGQPTFVTRAEGNVITELDGQRPSVAIQSLFESLSKEDKILMRQSLFLGVVMSASQQRYGPGDFLIRNIIGLDPHNGALGVAARVSTNDVVQFHLRDRHTSATDLRTLLAAYESQASGVANAMMFSCLGRGRGLYDKPNIDSNIIADALGRGPLAGFFCNGEIGPVGGRTHLHGYTCSLALIRPKHEH